MLETQKYILKMGRKFSEYNQRVYPKSYYTIDSVDKGGDSDAE